MPLFQIKHRFSAKVLFELECDSLKLCVEAAVSARAYLADANLARAYLTDANLARAYLTGANLAGANLAGANLAGAYLAGAYLAGAYLTDAYLAGANLADANLAGANLAGADLADADLAGADLTGADLTGAKNIPERALRAIRDDFFAVLLQAIPEVPGLLAALNEGRVDGSTYEGDCACLVGTIANVRHVNYADLKLADSSRPIERWFLAINKGDTPATNAAAKQAVEWIGEFKRLIGQAS